MQSNPLYFLEGLVSAQALLLLDKPVSSNTIFKNIEQES